MTRTSAKKIAVIAADKTKLTRRFMLSGVVYSKAPAFAGLRCFEPLRGRGPRRSIASGFLMCRNIKTLFNFEPPATEEEVRAASLQFVRKLSGFNKPSKANEERFDRAVEEVAEVARRLLEGLETAAPPRDREVEAQKARARALERFGAR